MPTIDTNPISEGSMIIFARSDKDELADSTGNYRAVRFNATKHGILSNLAVLAHENHDEFDSPQAALIAEHRPAGMTEQHLVEELATIIWRKRRVLLAEGAEINRGLRIVANAGAQLRNVQSAAPFERGMSVDAPQFAEMMSAPNASRKPLLILQQPGRQRRFFVKVGRMPMKKHAGRS